MSRPASTILLAASMMLCACAPPPASTAASPKPAYITVVIQSDGNVTIDGEVVLKDDLEQRFNALKEADATVIIAPEQNADKKTFVDVIMLATRTGLVDKMGVIGGT